jgi:thiol-disulfide isomerase/thioredoxin
VIGVLAHAASRPATPGIGAPAAQIAAIAPSRRVRLPDLAASSVDGGRRVSVTDFRGRVVVLNAWQSWCAPCRAELPVLTRLFRETDHDRVAFVGLDVKDDPVAASNLLRASAVGYPTLADPDGRLLVSLAAFVPPAAVPSTIVIDPAGRVAATVVGPADPSALKALIESVAAEPPG